MFLKNKLYCEPGHCFKCCPGNICQNDPENHLRNWYPGEALCTYTPRPKWIKRQFKINKLFLAGKISDDKYFILKDLIGLYQIRAGIKGRHNPDNKPPVGTILAPNMPRVVRKHRPKTPESYLPSSHAQERQK